MIQDRLQEKSKMLGRHIVNVMVCRTTGNPNIKMFYWDDRVWDMPKDQHQDWMRTPRHHSLGMVEINWLDLLYQDGIQVSQPRNQFLPRFESARLKKIFESRLYFWGVRLPAGRNSICFGMWSNYPPPTLSRSLDLPADGL